MAYFIGLRSEAMEIDTNDHRTQKQKKGLIDLMMALEEFPEMCWEGMYYERKKLAHRSAEVHDDYKRKLIV
jgi:hypothetical protein